MKPEVYDGSFEYINSTESIFASPDIIGSILTIESRQLCILRQHPVCKSFPDARFFKARLVFYGVEKSIRRIAEHIGDSRNCKGFRKPYTVEDGPFPVSPCSEERKEYGLEGTLESPSAWIHDWIIVAHSFSLEVEGPVENLG